MLRKPLLYPLFPVWSYCSRGRHHQGGWVNRRKISCGAALASTMKDTMQPLGPRYNPREVEEGWYAWWESRGFFRKTGAEEKFVMVLPPPNVTGTLHLGHALTCSVQDAIARWHQMRGCEVVFIPGCDHAGIATQAVVERHLLASQGVTRHQLGREKFLGEVWKWKNDKGSRIFDQMKRLGTSLDWSRSVFTMDDHMSEAVQEAFIRLFESGLVYRKHAPVNWCPSLQSTISDIEVEHSHLTGPTELTVPGYDEPVMFGNMYDFAYKVVGQDEELIVSTTRPETMLGDTAVMVHPEDSRFARFVGEFVYHPFRREAIPVVADIAVDPDFGTGVVKVTPAHTKIDFEVGLRHQLSQISVIDERGCLTDVVKEFEGLPRFKARTIIVEALKKLDLFRGIHPHPMMLPRCSRTSDVIEELLRPQWFIKCSEMSGEAIKAVRSGDLQLHPETHRRTWEEWLEDDRDWCISRQLWWGHRIPVYSLGRREGEDLWVAAHSEDDARKRAIEKGTPESEITSIRQDVDVLDTWFSSGLYPFAALGWPQDTQDLQTFYPTTLLETGHDILFFWVARMVMLGLKLTGELPFKTVLLHGLLCDADGHKMSKSRGNIIDPLDIINGATIQELNQRTGLGRQLLKAGGSNNKDGIPECGADALRFTLCSTNFKNQLLSVDINRAEQNRFLCNKIWQTVRFLVSALDKTENSKQAASTVKISQREDLSLMDCWILDQLALLIQTSNHHFEAYDLHQVTTAFTKFWYDSLCDVYLESIKPILKFGPHTARISALQTLWTVVDAGMVVLSPFMPYLSEELYHRLPRVEERRESVMECEYPVSSEWSVWRDTHTNSLVNSVQQVASAIRTLTAQYRIPATKAQGSVATTDSELATALSENLPVVRALSRVRSLSVMERLAAPPASSAVTVVSPATSVYLHLQDLVNVSGELSRLRKKAVKLEKELEKLTSRRSHPRYFQSTPTHKQEAHSHKILELKSELRQINDLIANLEKV